MENVTDRLCNPFGMEPECESFVPGYGDANAHFHVVGDHPGVHGGADTGVPFTDESGLRLQSALVEAGVLERAGERPRPGRTFLSYLHMCVPEGEPDDADYLELEPYFDAELRAIAAHVLLPVGERATRHVLENYTARAWKTVVDMEALHATELLGSGWLVVPIKDPAAWDDDDARELVDALVELQSTDYRREADLGRFFPGGDSYLVR
ncbi:MAG: uracil-DNA glycosylase family protein [Haloferacaceae archaeon]